LPPLCTACARFPSGAAEGFFPEGKNREPSAEQAGEGAEISSFFGFVFFFALSAPSLCNDMSEKGEACLFLDFGAFFAMLKKN